MAKCLSNSYIDEGQSASFGVTGGFQKNRDRTHREFFCVELWGNGPNLWKLGIHATVLTGERGLPCGFEPLFGKVPWRREWHPTPVFLPGESHGRRTLPAKERCLGHPGSPHGTRSPARSHRRQGTCPWGPRLLAPSGQSTLRVTPSPVAPRTGCCGVSFRDHVKLKYQGKTSQW